MFQYLKFLKWFGKNYCNYKKYFSSNFSSLVWKHFAPAIGAKYFQTRVDIIGARYFHNSLECFRPRHEGRAGTGVWL